MGLPRRLLRVFAMSPPQPTPSGPPRTPTPPPVVVASGLLLGSHRAHAINVVKTAGGFARLGHPVTLCCAGVEPGLSIPAALALYGEPSLSVELLPGGPDAGDEALGDWSARRAADLGACLLYARHYHAADAAARLGVPAVMETHAHVGDRNPALRAACAATSRPVRPVTGIATISPALRDFYLTLGADPTRIELVPDGVDLDLFTPPAPPIIAPLHDAPGPLAVYAGHLYDYKGIPTLLAAAALAPDVTWRLVGGLPEDIARVAQRIHAAALPNVHLHGHVPHAAVPAHLWAAAALVLPPLAGDPSARWTSPVKLGEYLAAGPPIIASSIPGLRTWVDAPAVRWFEPDDAPALVAALRAALAESPADARARRAAATIAARRFSYPERARRMLRLGGVAIREAAA